MAGEYAPRFVQYIESTMKARSSYYKLGLFVLSAVVLGMAGLLVLGAGALMQDSIEMETYLDESVQGLSVGSPVKERGVQIGVVEEINFARNVYSLGSDNDPNNYGRYVVVKMSLPAKGKFQADRLNKEIERGLRVRLVAQGITGQLFLEVDYLAPEKSPPLAISWEPESLYIPSAQSVLTRIGSAVDDLIEQMEHAEVEKIARNIDLLVVAMTRAIESARVDRLSQETTGLLGELRQTNQALNALVTDPHLKRVPGELSAAIADIRRTTRRLDTMVAGNQSGVTEAVENLRQVSQDMKELTANARQYPSLIFFGDAPGRATTAR
jgi:phospholipid/cholesterol/gamma-HCH transport system substrate-binding protein/paraquat-inducible protein B